MDNGPNNTTKERPPSWSERIKKSDKFVSRTCCIYNRSSKQGEENSECSCRRLVRRHSFEDECLNIWEELFSTDDGFNEGYSKQVKLNIWGEIDSSGCKCKYLRCDYNTDMQDIYDLIVGDCGVEKPPFIISVCGGAKYFSITDRLEKEFMRGIIHTATTANAWIVTAGINNGISKLVGEGISQDHALKEDPEKVICIGLTMWGSIGEQTRLKLRQNSANQIDVAEIISIHSSDTTNQDNPRNWLEKQTLADKIEDNKNMLEENHTHCILFDSGRMYDYLTDKQRSEFVTVACSNAENCYSVTIIVEGGIGTLEVLENDIESKRSIVLIQGSGRIADVIANLIDLTTNVGQNQQRDATEKEIENAYQDKFPNYPSDKLSKIVRRTTKLLKAENRCFLNVFRLDRDINVAETIFKAIFKAINYRRQQNPSDNTAQDYNLKLANLALKWNYFDGAKHILELPTYTDNGEQLAIIQDITKTKDLFLESLNLNRPEFIDYFLRSGFDPRKLASSLNIDQCQEMIVKLYKTKSDWKTEIHSRHIFSAFGPSHIKSIGSLNKKLGTLLGPFIYPIYCHTKPNKFIRVFIHRRGQHPENTQDDQNNSSINASNELIPKRLSHEEKEVFYSEQEMLRDLFFWSIFMDFPQMAKVFLAHLRPRICGALIASAIFKRYAEKSANIDFKQEMLGQALDFELYAAKCVDQCYDYNEETTCQLLLRQIPLFGKVTCMQVAISSDNTQFLETPCFDQALNQVWCDKLALTNHHLQAKPSLCLSILFFGLPAPFLVKYRSDDDRSRDDKKVKFKLSSRGINYNSEKKTTKPRCFSTFSKKFIYFHRSPMIRMCYHFISYAWFLLVFSYMMLYNFDLPSEKRRVHWTEIYVIVTVSSMLIEELRRRVFEFNNRMLETRNPTGWSIVTFFNRVFYLTLYPLFYLGIAFRYGSGGNRNLLTTARILLAFDLELWYLRSLKFVIALKFLGPKLFMLKNMLRDLSAFVYMVFIAIAAYGVVSRSLVLYKQVPFDGRSIFGQIFYPPYWFIYGQVSDTDMLDDLIQNATSTKQAEATATHILLAFHMLFINVLLLNLLIAVFADTIGKVQKNTDFYWRYQRYSFVREYFEQSFIAYPPLNILTHLGLLIYVFKKIKRICYQRNRISNGNKRETSKESTTDLLSIFKFIPVDGQSLDEHWDMFESAATLSYARSTLEKKKQFSSFAGNRNLLSEISDEQRTISTNFNLSSTNADENLSSNSDRQNTIDYLRDEFAGIRSKLTDVQTQLSQRNATIENLHTKIDQMAESMKSMMDSRNPVEINQQLPL